jgi:predicted metalloprotease with PDZ domain
MKKNLFVLTMLMLVTLGAYAGNSDSYIYVLDLSQVENDRTKVTLITPKIKTDEVLFSLPKTIPGTYSVLDYGRFVDTFKAFDKRGNELEVKKEGINGWKIFNAKKLSKISYWVADTFDYEFGEDIYIFEPAGTNIEEGLSFVINGGGFFGYFDGMTRNSFKFHIIRASSFYGATGLVASQTGKQVSEIKDLKGWKGNADQVLVDTYRTSTYDQLIDSPLMYCEPDTSVFEVGGAEIIISSFSPEGKVKAADIKNNLITLLSAQKDYLGGKLPVNKYAFIFYFTERKVRAIGALEHSYSSFYSLKNGSIESMQNMMNRDELNK